MERTWELLDYWKSYRGCYKDTFLIPHEPEMEHASISCESCRQFPIGVMHDTDSKSWKEGQLH